MRVHLGAFVVLACLGVGSAQSAEIPAACQAQAPWGAPQWSGTEPRLTPLCRRAYVVLHDDVKLVPDFVSWSLTAEHALGCLPRKDSFAPDPDLPPDHRAELADYKGHAGVYDRGHFAPNSDFEWDAQVQRESFYLSNMSPQASHLNQWEWEALEEATRAWALDRGPLIVMDGPIWKEPVETIGADGVGVPAAYWKVVVDGSGQVAAFIMQNQPTPKGDLTPYAVSVAKVEQAAGFALPLPFNVDKTSIGAIWPSDTEVFQRRKHAICHVSGQDGG
ncbi:DNA/RNA non-specific endonuclease [Nitrospirillum viridazoti]|uniref:Endonuclease n=1 Tax=Nitrospirillum viridazoti CBAmc TaxID=1441467 RepID=A0A248JYE5_9PROT|nr:DNA/RNA non-specific endonuclease [Nitrospirillum amazonense]ASG23224.1 endonuclease [Nitrospirillum amazonense CBAmc]TWB38984.1 endonuclease G [Nitrospirillum amazonense]